MSDLRTAIDIFLAMFIFIIFSQALIYWCTRAFIKGKRDGHTK